MKAYFIHTLGISLVFFVLTSCCQQKMCCNKWTEKDCYYSGYYQSSPAFIPNHNADYHSDFSR